MIRSQKMAKESLEIGPDSPVPLKINSIFITLCGPYAAGFVLVFVCECSLNADPMYS